VIAWYSVAGRSSEAMRLRIGLVVEKAAGGDARVIITGLRHNEKP
jgi:hypothetical protein